MTHDGIDLSFVALSFSALLQSAWQCILSVQITDQHRHSEAMPQVSQTIHVEKVPFGTSSLECTSPCITNETWLQDCYQTLSCSHESRSCNIVQIWQQGGHLTLSCCIKADFALQSKHGCRFVTGISFCEGRF